SLPFDRLADPETGVALPAEELERRLRAAGLTPEKPIVTSCGSGVTPRALPFALPPLRRPRAAVYARPRARMGPPRAPPVPAGRAGAGALSASPVAPLTLVAATASRVSDRAAP